ncbi:MAG: lysophospholipid acyltransferase family protein [Candidatus Eisenbacteria bacterium]
MSLHYSATRSILDGLIGILTGWQVRGRSFVPMDGGLIVASNHISYFDPPFVGTAAVRELHFLAKEELFRPPVFGAIIRAYNSIPIRRGAVDMRGLGRALKVLRAGHALILFPEGTRARDGHLHPAKPGVGMLAVNTDARILPCYISGSDRAPAQWITRRIRPRVSFGESRTWQQLAGANAGLEPGRALYQCVGDGVMREIATLKAAQ